MLALVFTFPAGRYHATPWGRHVNEADVAWPPEPWRILRALVATWYRKADRDAFSGDALAALIDRLAERPPDYALPESVVHAHSRHYMPQAAAGDTKLVFDAFARFPAGEPIVAVWPDLTLEDEALALLRHLAERIGYLGRAESWAECRVETEDKRWTINCRPSSSDDQDGDDGDRKDGAETVRIIAPLSPAGYAQERTRLLAAAEAQVLASWTKPKPPTGKALAKLIAPTAAILPERLFDALALDTGDFQRQGWSRPPASGDVLYRRVPLSPLPRHRTGRPNRTETNLPTVARFLLAGRPRPRVEDTVKIGELMRLATLARFGWDTDPATGRRRPRAPAVFLGKNADGRPLADDPAHAHAFWLPQDADGDGFIDHVVVYANGGFDAKARAALDQVTRLWIREPDRGRRSEEETDEAPDIRQEWRLALEGFGTPKDFENDVPFLRESRTWISATPFLASGHLKAGGRCAEARRLLIRRGIVPADQAHRLEVTEEKTIRINGRDRLPLHFHRFRASRGEAQLDTAGTFLRITLPEAKRGPLALGYACHFGLGLFMPAEPKPDD
ncbi:type I-G CRISPR-associated protein Csb2 [Azospirillum thermophilum]|uniref:Type I-U CRISPR-associated protein Cas5/Cas6 n=1 Tax=Azospirillum thermophilum TaxID=2202148 RepID=A0A2S2CKM6_9PROT|nr:type I-U CRISPR-associated protein Csb2 [Azospirillum thermophilum]AWK84920.1 type I-U CRISPR-associated protein Cas5/Cas6 [Azospirillum thermophilum]